MCLSKGPPSFLYQQIILQVGAIIKTRALGWSKRGFVIGCAVPLLSLVLSGGNDHDVQVGAVDPG